MFLIVYVKSSIEVSRQLLVYQYICSLTYWSTAYYQTKLETRPYETASRAYPPALIF